MARAEAALANLSGRYIAWAEADLARLEACWALVMAEPDQRPSHLATLFQIAHDMKGQGSTFDYPLVSELGQRLCRLLETRPEALEPMAALVAALGRVIRERLSGDGGAIGNTLLGE
ncbi:hypothetical protein A6A04_00490 [Paramagnetospirillum marisnigri]|uniref:HPt domain-containing protein n=2 Tax=Paramagnetospirillum marisnigri TaxID=1285242 RepID=A0A178MSF4_9PROT|nr:hypothetical protein A6A04_00490 [Paramagnetospirillum marisnigri]